MVTMHRPTEYSGTEGATHKPKAGPQLHIAVVFTAAEATLAALRRAGELAKGLAAQITLVAVEAVPFPLPVNRPSVALSFLEERLRDLILRAHLRQDEVVLKICVCRDRKQCLQEVLPPRALVVVGGTRHWWSRERRLGQWLGAQGHPVVLVEPGRYGRA